MTKNTNTTAGSTSTPITPQADAPASVDRPRKATTTSKAARQRERDDRRDRRRLDRRESLDEVKHRSFVAFTTIRRYEARWDLLRDLLLDRRLTRQDILVAWSIIAKNDEDFGDLALCLESHEAVRRISELDEAEFAQSYGRLYTFGFIDSNGQMGTRRRL